MKANFLLLIILLFVFSISGLGQKSSSGDCQQSFSTKFDEFEFTNFEDIKERLDLYGLQIKNLNAQGVIVSYGGKMTETNQFRSIGYKVEEYLTDKFSLHKYVTLSMINGGHREEPSIELFIKPQTCSSNPQPTPSLSYDEITYKEEISFFSKEIVQKKIGELELLVVQKVEPAYPPAAKAVRARGKIMFLITVNEEGNVIKAIALDGHPLLKTASVNAVQKRKYQILKHNEKPINYGGKVVIDWDVIADKWESEYDIVNN
ncbi:MAG: energy transducer TonB [Acidobacteriota bacterium]|jgi:hypothetical protein|nr:energy transducer TonB [Acidobacteriota bacterium]